MNCSDLSQVLYPLPTTLRLDNLDFFLAKQPTVNILQLLISFCHSKDIQHCRQCHSTLKAQLRNITRYINNGFQAINVAIG